MEPLRLRASVNRVLEYTKKSPPTASRNLLLLIGIRELVVHFGKLVKEIVNSMVDTPR